jgi:hypothetical protein
MFGPRKRGESRQAPRRAFRPWLERLEDRLCPNAYTWVGAVPDQLGVGDGVYWANGLNWRTTDGLHAAPDGGPGFADIASINKGDFGSIVYDSQCSGWVDGLHLSAGDLELGVPMLT